MSTSRIFNNTHMLALIAWWFAALLLAWVIANDTLPIAVRIAAGVALWAPTLIAPFMLQRRTETLDEMQQILLWRTLAGAGLWITGYLAAMGAYFMIIGGVSTVALLVLCALAAPSALVFAAVMSRFSERALERDDGPAQV